MHLSSFENNEGIKQFKKIKLKLFNRVTAKLDSQFLVDDPAD